MLRKLSLLVDGEGRAAAFLTCVALTTAPPSAFAADLFSTSYEAPTYSVGPLDGQDGWVNSFDIDPAVTSDFARTGSQSLEVLQAEGENPFGLTFRVGPYSTSAPKVSVEHSVYLDGTDGWDSTFVSPLALGGENGFVAQLAIRDGATANLGLADIGVGGVPIQTDRWITLELVLDFPTQTVEGFVDGVSIGSGPFASPTTELVQVEIFHIFGFGNPGPSPSFFVDDLSISSIPLVPTCGGHDATVFVDADGFVVGGPADGSHYPGALFGTLGADVIVGTETKDLLFGLSGPDIICGLGGRDLLIGGLGDDDLFGDEGKDGLLGGPGNDILDGGPSVDRCIGGPGRDQLLSCERGDDEEDDD